LITHIYVARLKPGTSDADVAIWLQAIDALDIEGMLEIRSGSDLDLREANWDVAITADFSDVAAWHRYNDDALHNQIRNEHAKPIVEAQQRVQFERSLHFKAPGDIRNVTLLAFRPDAPAGQGEKAVARLRQLRCKGMHHLDAGVDLGLQDGNASAAVLCDFDSPEAYNVYDLNELHNEIRAQDIKPFAETIRRVQFELPPAP
jgi:stress responsive alpha/beta barrel protein